MAFIKAEVTCAAICKIRGKKTVLIVRKFYYFRLQKAQLFRVELLDDLNQQK